MTRPGGVAKRFYELGDRVRPEERAVSHDLRR